MLFEQIILNMAVRMNGERTISAPFHLIRGKRSGQTIQDVKIYGLTNYFSLFPKLPKHTYDRIIESMVQNKWLILNEKTIPIVTSLGMEQVKKLPTIQLNGWLYRGNERLFFQRLSLVTQTLSHVRAKELAFTPVEKNEKVQYWVRQYIHSYPYQSEQFIKQYFQELLVAFKCSGLSDLQLTLITHRLSGYRVSGITWQQLAQGLNEEPIDLHIRFVEALHLLLDQIVVNPDLKILRNMSEGIRTTTALTDSAQKTFALYQDGYSFEQIVSARQLKSSTIEDHFVEIAMNEPSFVIEMFFPNEQIHNLIQQVKEQGTKKLTTLKAAFPDFSYFQLRLLLAVGGALG